MAAMLYLFTAVCMAYECATRALPMCLHSLYPRNSSVNCDVTGYMMRAHQYLIGVPYSVQTAMPPQGAQGDPKPSTIGACSPWPQLLAILLRGVPTFHNAQFHLDVLCSLLKCEECF